MADNDQALEISWWFLLLWGHSLVSALDKVNIFPPGKMPSFLELDQSLNKVITSTHLQKCNERWILVTCSFCGCANKNSKQFSHRAQKTVQRVPLSLSVSTFHCSIFEASEVINGKSPQCYKNLTQSFPKVDQNSINDSLSTYKMHLVKRILSFQKVFLLRFV